MPWPRSGPAAAGTRGTRRIRKPSAFTPLVLLFAGEGEGGCVGKGRRLRPIGSSVDPSMQILDPEFEVRLVILRSENQLRRGKMLALDSCRRCRTFRRSHQPIHNKEEPTMPMTIQHVHIKSKDPKQAAQFYMDNLGATLKSEITGRGCQLDLHGLQLNVTGIVATQSRQQTLGIEHIAVEPDDYTGTLAKLKANGVRILEEMPPNANGRRVCLPA